MKKYLYLFALIIFAATTFEGCKQFSDLTKTFTNLKRLQFKLTSVSDMSLSGVNISRVKGVKDLSTMDVIKLTGNVAQKRLPADFTLNVAASNPNDGTGGSTQTSSTLTSLNWRLYIDETETVRGDINSPIKVPGTGSSVNIPLGISLDLYKFFGSQGYDKLLNLALAIGGAGSSPARLKLDAQPTVTTPFGPISYPGRITIVDKEWN